MVTISDVPAGAVLSAGTNNGNGSWTLTPAQLAGLTITPPDDSDADFTLTVTSTATSLDGLSASATASVGVMVIADADVPTLSTSDITGGPNAAIPLAIASNLMDTDGSESLSIQIAGVPSGGVLSAGTNNGGGIWTLTAAQISGLTITVPPGTPHFSLAVVSTATESSNGDFESVTGSINVTMTAINHAPIAFDDGYTSGFNETLVVGGPGVLVNDSDPLDTPANNLFSDLIDGANFGTLTLNQDGSFTYTPNAGFYGADTFTYQVRDDGGTLYGGDDTGNIATVSIFIDAPIGYVNIPPVAYDSSLLGLQDTPIDGTATATDADHPISSLVYNLVAGPAVGTLTFNADGTFSFVPPTGYAGVQTFTFRVTDPWGDSDIGEITLDIAQTIVPPDFLPAPLGSPSKTPVMAELTGGGFVMAWSTTDLDAGGANPGDGAQDCIYFQRYSADGSLIGPPTIANTTTAGSQNLPAVTEMADGGFMLFWGSSGNSQDSSGYGAFGQRFNATGQMVTRDGLTLGADEVHVSTATAGDQYSVRATTLPDGGWVVTWESDDVSAYGVFSQRFAADGTPIGGETQVNDFTISSQYQQDVIALADGGYLVTWASFFQDYVQYGAPALADYGVYAQRYNAAGQAVLQDGTTLGVDSFRIATTTVDNQEKPRVCALSNGGFAIAWHDSGSLDGAAHGTFFKTFDAAGNESTLEIQVNTTVAGDQWQPAIAQLSDGSIFVVWSANNSQDGDGFGIFGQKFALDGTRIGEEYQINSNVPSDQSFPEIQALADGTFVIAWQTQVGGGNNVEQIAGRMFSNNTDGLRDLSTGLGNDLILGSAGVDKIDTGGGSDTIDAKGGNDVIKGGDGGDLMTGGAGSDTFKWMTQSEGQSFSLLDSITDFEAGAGGDRLDVSAFITLGGGNITDFVQLAVSGGSMVVQVDVDGLSNGANFQNLVRLEDVTGLNVNDLFANNNLVVTL